MSARTASRFVGAAPHNDPAFIWDADRLGEFGGRHVPEEVLGQHDDLLRGDQANLWLRWYVEGIASPRPFVADPSRTWVHVYAEVLPRIHKRFAEDSGAEREKLARAIADHLYSEVKRLRLLGRKDATRSQKEALIQASTPPRCYLCGYAFGQEAVDTFLRRADADPIVMPKLVDVFRPRGLRPHEVKIEVEHVFPVISGGAGDDNLRLSCGWCNRAKSSNTSIYDASFTPRDAKGAQLPRLDGSPIFQLPEPFWTVRIVAFQGHCQIEGCSATLQNSELRIALRDLAGSPNPTNLYAVCDQHDPFAKDRFQDPSTCSAMWKK